MKTYTYLVQLVIAAGLLLITSCSEENNSNKRIENESFTQIFGEAPEPDTTSYNHDGRYAEDGKFIAFDGASGSYEGGGGSTGSTGSWGSGSSTNPGIQAQPGLITAAQWSDLDNWPFWTDMLNNQEYLEDVNTWDIHILSRYSFLVTDISGKPVTNAVISLKSGQSVVWKAGTDSKGKAEAWSATSASGIKAEITYNNENHDVALVKEYDEGINEITMNTNADELSIADIMFVVDATGSMSDEINYLKAELYDVIDQIQQTSENIQMNLGSVFYRDEGDEYVTKPFTFTQNKDDLLSFISAQEASGGGDFPEAVHTALEVAIGQMQWDANAKSKLLFLLLDAPPHYNQDVVSSLQTQITAASESGIKIIPITASGIDKATEFLMRSIAILTNSSYVFITDDSGIGNDHLEPTIGQYEIEKLNELIIRIITEDIE